MTDVHVADVGRSVVLRCKFGGKTYCGHQRRARAATLRFTTPDWGLVPMRSRPQGPCLYNIGFLVLGSLILSRSFWPKHEKKEIRFLEGQNMQGARVININPHLYLALVPSALETRYRGIYIISLYAVTNIITTHIYSTGL